MAADAENSSIAITDEEVLCVQDKAKAAFQVLTGSKPVWSSFKFQVNWLSGEETSSFKLLLLFWILYISIVYAPAVKRPEPNEVEATPNLKSIQASLNYTIASILKFNQNRNNLSIQLFLFVNLFRISFQT